MAEGDFNLDDLIAQIDQAGTKGVSSPSGLRFNPFPVTGIGGDGSTAALPPVQPEVRDEVRDFLFAALSSGEFTGATVIGDFGMGKTHLLRWIEKIINGAHVRPDGERLRAYYVSNPGIRPMDILMSVTKAIGEEEFRKMLWAVVAKDLRNHLARGGLIGLLAALGHGDRQPTLMQRDEHLDMLAHDETLDNLGKFQEHFKATYLPPRALNDYVTQALTQVSPNLDVVQAFTSMVIDEQMKAFTSWVSLTSTEGRQQLRVPQQDYFAAILNVLKQNGVGTVFLLIDEFEDVVGWRFSPRQRAEYLATLRLLIDANLMGFSLILGLIPEAWSVSRSIYPAIGDRMGQRVIELRPLTLDKAEELARRYLVTAREQGVENSLAPFSSKAIGRIAQITEGNARAFVSACYRVLAKYWSEPQIGAEDVDLVLSR